MDMSLKVNMYNGHVLEGKLCIMDMYLVYVIFLANVSPNKSMLRGRKIAH